MAAHDLCTRDCLHPRRLLARALLAPAPEAQAVCAADGDLPEVAAVTRITTDIPPREYPLEDVFTRKQGSGSELPSEEVKRAYAIWRGNHRGTQPPPHWDHLGDDMQQVAAPMYRMGASWGFRP